MTMSVSAVDVRRAGVLAEIILNRPDKLNALDMQLIQDLDAAVGTLRDDPSLRVVVIRGAGRSFCSGLDLDMFAEQGMPPDFFPIQERAFTTLEHLPAIVIAQIHGHCLGGGLQLALACDIRIARADAMLGLPAALEGLVPGAAGWRLPRFVGMGRALRLALLGTPIGAAEAHDIGLVDHLLPESDFAESAAEVVRRYAELPYPAAAGVKELIRSAFDVGFDEAYHRTREIVEECLRTPVVTTAKRAWLERSRLDD